ncbi:hypothetical protein, variant [Aphanomyces astaci]|nr:hypothetical protein, variant [Aphanomyces astaci]ETV68499.1 hypothetical protein, variant [Aphanomyces astaci]|eukprot:XP_009841928.1 hypothetical protein, variant [Aphanomyces astaci]
MANDAADALSVHLTTAHGVKVLASIATNDDHDDLSLQAEALRLLSEHAHDPTIASAWESSSILTYVLASPALNDADSDLHLVLWRCLAQCAETVTPLLPQLWSARRSILDVATSIQDAPLHSTSLAAHTLAALVASVAEHAPALLVPSASTGPFAGFGDLSDLGLAFVRQVKLWYVLTNEAALLSMLAHATTTVSDVKVTFQAKLPALVCREYVLYHETFDLHYNAVAFLFNLVHVLWRDDVAAPESTTRHDQIFGHVVLRLCLSKHKIVWSEMRGVLEHIVTSSPDFAAANLVPQPHLRGAVAHLAAKSHDVAAWTTSLLGQVDTFETVHRINVIQLPSLQIDLTLRDAVDVATTLKTTGNRWFRDGNYTAARSFYRVALSTLTVSEAFNASRRPTAVKLTVGHPVKVQQGTAWLVGMVSDVNEDVVDVMFDNGTEADNVPIHKVHMLPVETSAIADLRLHLCMNSAKCLHALGCTQDAIECLTFALTVSSEHIPALYLR